MTSSASHTLRMDADGSRSDGYQAFGVTGCCGRSHNRLGVPSRFLLRGLAREGTHGSSRKDIKGR